MLNLVNSIAYAQEPAKSNLIANIKTEIGNPIITILFLLAFLYFLWGLIQFISSAGTSGAKLEEGKSHMIWGVVGMAIMLSAYGLMNLITNTITSIAH